VYLQSTHAGIIPAWVLIGRVRGGSVLHKNYLRGFVWGIIAAAILAMITFPFNRQGVQSFWLELFAGGAEFKQVAQRGFLQYLLIYELDALKIIGMVLLVFAVGDLIVKVFGWTRKK